MFSHDTEHSLQTIVDLVNTDPAYNDTEALPTSLRSRPSWRRTGSATPTG